MTFTLTDVLLLVIVGTLLVMAIQQARLGGRMARAADELKDAVTELRPELRRLVRDAEEALADVRRTSGRIDRIAEAAEEHVVLAQRILVPLSRRLVALVTGVKMAFVALRRGEAFTGKIRSAAAVSESTAE